MLNNRADAYKKLQAAQKDYKRKYSPIRHFFIRLGIPFGCLLFVYPGILLIRKSKELKQQKQALLDVVAENEQNTLKYNTAIDFLIQPHLIFNEVCEKELKYYDMGPVTNNFIKVMNGY